jgi:hypothetical protein
MFGMHLLKVLDEREAKVVYQMPPQVRFRQSR